MEIKLLIGVRLVKSLIQIQIEGFRVTLIYESITN
jgi:hypothetical protein